ncbi:MAG: hypothetical protein A2171_01400 [Candidatus Levybacteria bacterium RBG_13_35_9]|nr:MAG: hypothetical protein A2171_01400 [Candidatus Levybacteria bacterium RBG_13_35_9]
MADPNSKIKTSSFAKASEDRQKSKSSKATTMADLMKSVQTKFVSPKKGEVLEGIITKLTSAEILVDIGAKTEAVVLEKDGKILRSLLSTIKIGDKVTVSVLNPESDLGNPVVSLRRFNEDRVWEKLNNLLKTKEQLDVIIDEVTKGGFLVSTRDGISGFLPNSQASFLNAQADLPGKSIKASVIELNRPAKKVIFSQKTAMGGQEFDSAVKNIKRGQKIACVISNITPFGIFALIESDGQNVEGFIHISEVSWEKIQAIPQSFKQGERIEGEVLSIDRDSKRVTLSLKRLTKNPYEEKLKEFAPDKKVTGTVVKILSNGVTVDLGEGIEGFIKKEKIPPTLKFSEGASVEATVLEVDRKQRVVLAPVLKEKPIGYR